MSEQFNPERASYFARRANLQRQATSLSVQFRTDQRRFRKQAEANFAKAYAEQMANVPGFFLDESEQEAEIERMRKALMSLQALDNVQKRSTKSGNKKSRPVLGSNGTASTHSRHNHPTIKSDERATGANTGLDA